MRAPIAAFIALVASGCQQTNQQALEAAKPAWTGVRASLPSLAALVGQPGEGRLEGVSWVEMDPSQSNATFLTREQLNDPDAELDPQEAGLGKIEVHAGGDFLHCLNWTGPRSKMSSNALKERSGDRLSMECQLALQTQYLIVLEQTANTPPVLTSEGAFEGGEATARVTVIDRLAAKVLVSLSVEGKRGQLVKSEAKPGEDGAVRLTAAVHSTMWTHARQQIFEGLRERGATMTPR